MSSTGTYDFRTLLEDLDGAANLLSHGVRSLKGKQIDSEDYRIRYDNHHLTVGLAVSHLIIAIRNNCISEKGTLPIAYFCTRTLHELCIRVASVNFLESQFNYAQRRVLQEARLMEAIATEKDSIRMAQLLNDEHKNISNRCYLQINQLIECYRPLEHYKWHGFYHQLNDTAAKKIRSLYEHISESHINVSPILRGLLIDESDVIFSNLLHGNPIGVLIASEQNDTRPTIPFMLLRMTLFDAGLIAHFIGDSTLARQVEALTAKVLSSAYGE